MSDESIFEGQTPADGDTQPQVSTPTLPDSVKELVGPGKKYATVEKALEALAPAQSHIATLEAELKELRAKAEGVVSVEQVYATVQELLEKERRPAVTPALDEASLTGLLDRTLTAREQAAAKQQNIETVKSALTDKFGDKANEQFKAKAQELGLPISALNDLAAKSPKAVLEYFGVKPSGAPARTSSTVNTAALSTRQPDAQPLKTVMAGATTKEVTAHWNEIKERVLKGEN